MTQTPINKIAIVGAGISGLTAAWKCRELSAAAQITIFESSNEIGGVLQTESVDGYLIEKSADMFVTEPDNALEFARKLGRESELISTRQTKQRAFIAWNDAIYPVPSGLSLMLPNDLDAIGSTELLDDQGRQRFLNEREIPVPGINEDESLESFAVRRFGQQAFDRLFQPLVGGIYTADPKKLSMQATLERFRVMEREYGSLINAAETKRQSSADTTASGARYSIFRAPRNGMGRWIDWIVDALENVTIKNNCEIDSVHENDGWDLHANDGQTHSFDGLILAGAAKSSAKLIKDTDESLASNLNSITAASSAIVAIGFDNHQLQKQFDGFGIVIPSCLGRKTIALSFSSNKFEGRAPAGKTLVRCFIGGALQRELVDLPDDELIKIGIQELDQTLGVDGAPELCRVYRWKNCMPQYHLGHLDRIAAIENSIASLPGLQITGNSYRGVGVPMCLKIGFKAAERLLHHETQ